MYVAPAARVLVDLGLAGREDAEQAGVVGIRDDAHETLGVGRGHGRRLDAERGEPGRGLVPPRLGFILVQADACELDGRIHDLRHPVGAAPAAARRRSRAAAANAPTPPSTGTTAARAVTRVRRVSRASPVPASPGSGMPAPPPMPANRTPVASSRTLGSRTPVPDR